MNNDMIFQEKTFVKSSEANNQKELRLSSMFKMFQDATVMMVENLGFGKSKTMDKGYLWVISRISIEITKMPKYLDNIIIESYPENMIHFIYPMQFIIKYGDGSTALRISSIWALIDSDTRKTLFPSITNVFIKGISRDDRINRPKGINKQDITLKEKRIIRYSDTDMNGHLNNTRYFDFIQDMYGTKELNGYTIKKGEIIFNKEAIEGDELELYSSNNNEYFVGKVKDEQCFEATIKLEKKK